VAAPPARWVPTGQALLLLLLLLLLTPRILSSQLAVLRLLLLPLLLLLGMGRCVLPPQGRPPEGAATAASGGPAVGQHRGG
jgi:hypothetical protein